MSIIILGLIVSGIAAVLNIFNAKKTFTKQLSRRYSPRDIYEQMLDIEMSKLGYEVQGITYEDGIVWVRCRHIRMEVTVNGSGMLLIRYNLKMMLNAGKIVPGLFMLLCVPVMTAAILSLVEIVIGLDYETSIEDMLIGSSGGGTDISIINTIGIILIVIMTVIIIGIIRRSRKKALDEYGKRTAEKIAGYIN